MADVTTLQEFYREFFPADKKRFAISAELGHFNVFPRGIFCKQLSPFSRRDYFKISLIDGTARLHHTDRTYEIGPYALVFYNPNVPYTWETVSEKQAGYFCLFNSGFIAPVLSDKNFKQSPLFDVTMDPVYPITQELFQELSYVFKKMQTEVDSDYDGRFDAIRHYLQLITHEAHKIQPLAVGTEKYMNASSRISSLFIEMLERQFPVDSTEQALKLKSPHDFAGLLSVHVNHLNRAVKEITGKSTSELIAARVAAEAKALLKHTDNSVAEIAYSLGFEHASNFNNFFKKQTGLTPKAIRSVVV
jgi:AraC-like DNA-binding protein